MNARQTKLSMKKVQFNDNVHTLLVPYEDRKGEWMNSPNHRNVFLHFMLISPISHKGKLKKEFRVPDPDGQILPHNTVFL